MDEHSGFNTNPGPADNLAGNSAPDAASLPPHLRELRDRILDAQEAESAARSRRPKERIPFVGDLVMGLLAVAGFAYLFYWLGIFHALPRAAGGGLTGGAFGGIGGGLAAWFVGWSLLRAARRRGHRAKKRSAQAGGLITAADLARTPGRRGGWLYALVVSFQFEANGKTHSANWRTPENGAHNMMSLHKKNMKANHPGKVVRIYYEPEFPENAGLSRRPPFPWLALLIYLVIGGAVTGFGVHMLRVGLNLLLS